MLFGLFIGFICLYCLLGKQINSINKSTINSMIDLPIVQNKEPRKKKPDWLRVKLPIGQEYKKVRNLVDKYKLHTICQSGSCPRI